MAMKRTQQQEDVIKELEDFFERKKAEQQALRKLLEELNKPFNQELNLENRDSHLNRKSK